MTPVFFIPIIVSLHPPHIVLSIDQDTSDLQSGQKRTSVSTRFLKIIPGYAVVEKSIFLLSDHSDHGGELYP